MVAALALAGCSGEAAFLCRDNSNCGDGGFCEDDGNCSFEDTTCPSGRRYGSAGDALHANTCVEVQGTSSAVTTESPIVTTTSTTTATTSTTLATTSSTSTSSTTAGSSMTTADESTTTGEGTTEGESSSSSGGLGRSEFFDNFDRPDGADIGNGWWEKTPSSFSLAGGRVQRAGMVLEYPNNIVARPQAASGVNVVVDMEFHVLSTDPELGNPQVHARLQESGLMEPGSMTGYIGFVDDAGLLCALAVVDGDSQFLDCIMPDGPFEAGESYSLVLRVEGVGPVSLNISAFHYVRDQAQWEEYGSGELTDNTLNAIVDPGRVGFSASFELGSYEYDNFYASWWD